MEILKKKFKNNQLASTLTKFELRKERLLLNDAINSFKRTKELVAEAESVIDKEFESANLHLSSKVFCPLLLSNTHKLIDFKNDILNQAKLDYQSALEHLEATKIKFINKSREYDVMESRKASSVLDLKLDISQREDIQVAYLSDQNQRRQRCK